MVNKTLLATLRKQCFHKKHELLTILGYYLPFLPPHRYVFVLTNLCNLKCKYCYQEKKAKEILMKKEQWINLAKEIPSFCRITITGGEPLLFPNFKEVIKSVAKRHQCNLITNGTLLTPELIDFFLSLKNFKILAVSLDGIKQDTMKIRRISEKQWHDLEDNLRYFINRRNELNSNCILDIKSLILDENVERLQELHDYCVNNLRADNHSFQLLKGTPLQHSDREYSFGDMFKDYKAPIYKKFDTIIEQLNKIRQYNVANGTTAFLHPKFVNLNSSKQLGDLGFLNSSNFEKDRFKPCVFPWSSIHINYDGNFFPCISVPIGNVKENSFKEIITSKKYYKFRSIIRRNGTVGACNRCGWLRLR